GGNSLHGAPIGLLLLLGSVLLVMAGVFAIRREPLLERCAGLTGTSSVLAVGIYMTVFDVTSGYSWFEGTVSEGTAWLLVLPASIIALSCASWVLKSDPPASQSTATGRPTLNVQGPARGRRFLVAWVACAV